MNSKQLKESDILKWACNYLPSQQVYNMEFQDGQLISELIYQFYPSIKKLNHCNLRPKMILSLGYIKDFLRDNKIPIDFDIHRVASQSQSDILKLLSDIRQHLGHKQEQENPQKQKLNNLVKQAEIGKNVQPSPIRQRERQQLSGIWYPPSEHKSNHRQRSTSIGGGSRLSLHQQFSSKKNQEYQSSSISKSPILVEQEVIAKQDNQAQNYVQQNQQVNPNSQQQVDNRDRDRDIIQQQIQQAANQQQEIYKFVRQIEELMAQSANVLEFKRLVYNEVKNAIERYEYLTFHLWLDVLNQCAQPQDDGLIMAASLLRAYLGQNMSNIQILPSFSQWPLWQQLTERSIQRTNDAQTQCHLPSRAQSNYQTPNKSLLSYQNVSVSQVDHTRRSVQQSPHQSVTKNNTVIGNLSPIPYDQQSSSLQQPFDQSIQQPSLSFHTITDLSSMPQVQAIQQINENSQNSLHSIQLNGLQQNGLQQNIQQQTPQLYKYQNGSLSEQAANSGIAGMGNNSPLSFVSAPTQMIQLQTQQANQFVLNSPQQGNSQIVYQENAQQQQQFQELYIQQTPVTHKLSMYPNHTNESNRSIFQNTGYQHFNFPQQENYSTPQQLQVFPQIQTQSSQQRTSIFQNLFQSPFQQTPQFNEQQAQNQNINQQDDRSSAVNGERTQLIENVPPYQRNQMDQNEQQNTNDPSNPLMIQPGQTYNESQSSRGSQYNFQNK